VDAVPGMGSLRSLQSFALDAQQRAQLQGMTASSAARHDAAGAAGGGSSWRSAIVSEGACATLPESLRHQWPGHAAERTAVC
jgi:hypothetical protein